MTGYKEIEVYSQKELDAVPEDFYGKIIVKFGTRLDPAKLNKAWCVDYGRDWSDLAILEVEMPMDTMVVPKNCGGKVRADRVTVIREVPLEECGLLGKWLAEERKHG